MQLRSFIRFVVLAGVVLSPTWANEDSPRALAEGGHWKRLRALMEPRLRANVGDAEAAYRLSQVKKAFGDLDGALPLAEKAVAVDARNADYHHQLAMVCGDLAQKAGVFKQFGLARRFKKENEAALAIDPNHLDALEAMMHFHMEAPGLVGGDSKKVSEIADQIARINPARGHMVKVALAIRDKQRELVEGLYLKAADADPKYYAPRISLANFYLGPGQKKYELTEKYARDALQIDPGQIGAYSALAASYVLQKRHADVDTILALAERNIPDNLSPYMVVGRILISENGDLALAETYIRKYLSQEAEARAQTHAIAHWRLGQLREKQNRKADAISEYETAVRMQPELEVAKKDLKRLK